MSVDHRDYELHTDDGTTLTYDHVWAWRARPVDFTGGGFVVPIPTRMGQSCRIVSRGGMNSVLVEFDDGHKVLTSRYAVRKKVDSSLLR